MATNVQRGKKSRREVQPKTKGPKTEFAAAVGCALRRAAKVARKTARMHGTPIYVSKNGKVVALMPSGRPRR